MDTCPAWPGIRGQSNVLGFLLVFGIVISGIALIVVVGGTGLTDTQSQSEYQRAEHSMTLFDSRAAMVALGDASVQTVSLGHDSGSIQIEEAAGWMRVSHDNYTADSNSPREIVFNRSLGQVHYANDDRTIAYQGGGVWRTDTNGEARMISPPEFHYRGATLTLPIIRVFGDGFASGSVDMTVRPSEQTRLIYPNRTSVTQDGVGAPYNGSYRNYTNPVRNGTVNVTVRSQYYEGWATYFEERTTGNVTKWDHNETVRLELETVSGPPGDFEIPEVGDSITVGSMGDGHPISQFEVAIDVEKNKPHFSFYAEEDDEEFELHVYSDVKNKPCPSPDGDVYLSTYYYDGDGSQTYESWSSEALDPDSQDGLEWVCDSGDASLSIDFVEDGIDMEYAEMGSKGDGPSSGGATGVTRGNKYAFGDRIKSGDWTLRDPAIWDQHSMDGNAEYTPGDDHSLEAIINHYLSAMDGDVDLIAKDGPGNSDAINEQGSTGVLLYDESAGAQYVTYLHITENGIEVDLD